ncbi:MAG TPA: hypothetical protein DIT58_12795 [Porticoccaceae bacterium]|nr:hypothetical protein [Porticoccaceae bacterium]
MSFTEHDVHIVFGETAWGSLIQAFHFRHLRVLRDPLPLGPVKTFSDIEEFKKTRSSYWEYLFSLPGCRLDTEERDLLNDLTWISGDNCIYIWAGSGLADQLLVLLVVYLVQVTGENSEKLRLIQYKTFNDNNLPMHSIAYLNPDEIKKHPTPTSLTKEQIQFYLDGWRAYTHETPQLLLEYCSQREPENRITTGALENVFLRYPQWDTGLNTLDYKLTTHTTPDGRLASDIMRELLAEDQHGDFVTDYLLHNRLARLAGTSMNEPLINLSSKINHYQDATVSLTDFGRSIEEGTASNYPTNAIDEWIGGVHLSSEENRLWFSKDGRIERSFNR